MRVWYWWPVLISSSSGKKTEAASSQLGQLVHGRVVFEVWREKFRSSRVDDLARLSDGDECDPGDVSDFCGRFRDKAEMFEQQKLYWHLMHFQR